MLPRVTVPSLFSLPNVSLSYFHVTASFLSLLQFGFCPNHLTESFLAISLSDRAETVRPDSLFIFHSSQLIPAGYAPFSPPCLSGLCYLLPLSLPWALIALWFGPCPASHLPLSTSSPWFQLLLWHSCIQPRPCFHVPASSF